MNFISLQTQRLVIQPLNPSYAKDILDSIQGNVKEYFIDFKNLSEVEGWIKENIELIKVGKKIETVVIDQDSKDFIGMVAIDGLDTDEPEIRLWISPIKQGQGYAKEAVKALMDWFSGNYQQKQLIYTADKVNEASNKLAIRLGFRFDKEFIDEDGSLTMKYNLI